MVSDSSQDSSPQDAPQLGEEKSVLYEVTDGVATITLNRPARFNAMNDQLMGELGLAFGQVVDDESVRVAILTGAGRGFCAGADLNSVADPDDQSINSSDDGTFLKAMRAIADCPVPTIGRINGAAAGGGFGLSMACDISIAARSAFFVATFGPRLGIVPDMGTTWHLPARVGAARARGIAMLGGRITAEQAAEWGLIWDVVNDDQLDAAVADIADLFKRTSPDAMTRIRSSIADAERNTLSDQLDLEMAHQAVLIPANMVEGAEAFIAKREPTFSPRRQHP